MTTSPPVGRWRWATRWLPTLVLGLTLPFQPGCLCGCSTPHAKADAEVCRAPDCSRCPPSADRGDPPAVRR